MCNICMCPRSYRSTVATATRQHIPHMLVYKRMSNRSNQNTKTISRLQSLDWPMNNLVTCHGSIFRDPPENWWFWRVVETNKRKTRSGLAAHCKCSQGSYGSKGLSFTSLFSGFLWRLWCWALLPYHVLTRNPDDGKRLSRSPSYGMEKMPSNCSAPSRCIQYRSAVN
jgi:hypothetical protein